MSTKNGHKLECDTCRHFIDQRCETCYDCAWVYECAKLGGVWGPRHAEEGELE